MDVASKPSGLAEQPSNEQTHIELPMGCCPIALFDFARDGNKFY